MSTDIMQPFPISIVVSDPWDLGAATNWAPIKGSVVGVNVSEIDGRVLLRFETPIDYRGATYAFAVATPRLEGQTVSDIAVGTCTSASVIGISREQAESSMPFDTSAWRGGLAFIGDIRRTA
jgi:hypothetical protein